MLFVCANVNYGGRWWPFHELECIYDPFSRLVGRSVGRFINIYRQHWLAAAGGGVKMEFCIAMTVYDFTRPDELAGS